MYNVTNHGNAATDIQLWTSTLSITSGSYYLLTFHANCTTSFALAGITLQQNTSLCAGYSQTETSGTPTILATSLTTRPWATYSVLFKASVTASDARLDFYLGGAGGLPVGDTFYLDTLSFKKCVPTDGRDLLYDTGNIIFNNGASSNPCGVYYATQADLTTQGDFFSDPSNWTVKVYSTSNPASYYSDIELAQWAVNVVAGSYVTLQNLDLRYSASKAIEISDQHDVTVTGCDVSFIGGNFINFGGGTLLAIGRYHLALCQCF